MTKRDASSHEDELSPMLVVDTISHQSQVARATATATAAATATATAQAATRQETRSTPDKLHVVVIVLGDLGRSPRMQYHALSLLQEGHSVSLVGYQGEDLIPDLHVYQQETPAETDSPLLHVVRFNVPTPTAACGKIVYFICRILTLALWTTWALIARVSRHAPVDVVLVQNPPALPLLLVAWCFTWYLRIVRRQSYRPAFVIDWHNLGYTMLQGGIFQRVAKRYEQTMAPLADAHWTVTAAMKKYLAKQLLAPRKTNASTPLIQEVPDCPPAMFTVRNLSDQHAVLQKLGPALEDACPRAWKTNFNCTTQTLLTEVVTVENPNAQQGKQYTIRHRRGRPALVTSSTSWTPDEDFGILLQALLILDDKIQAEASGLTVLVVVTGKGPQKTMYERKISQLALRHVAVTTLWLEPVDYPRLIAAADLGVSLHTSTSGLDLPMKVLDLFGCQVPVCAMRFACLAELVQDGVNGRVFSNSEQLADQLWELLSPLEADSAASNHEFGDLAKFARNLQKRPRWHDNWQKQAWPVIEQVVTTRKKIHQNHKNGGNATPPQAPSP